MRRNEKTTVRIGGFVACPISIDRDTITLADALRLAGGFKDSSGNLVVRKRVKRVGPHKSVLVINIRKRPELGNMVLLKRGDSVGASWDAGYIKNCKQSLRKKHF
jgi:hypothetical protein